MKRKALKAAFPLTLPVMAGYLFLGLGFGILLASKGFSFLWAAFMSIIIYAGSMQYVAIDLLAAGASFITTAIMTVMIQIRHLFYGLSLIVKYKNVGKRTSGRRGCGMVLLFYFPFRSLLLDLRLYAWRPVRLAGKVQYEGRGFCHDRPVSCAFC